MVLPNQRSQKNTSFKKLSPIKRSSVPGEGLQSCTKMDFAISSHIEPFKALAITNTPPSPLPAPNPHPHQKNVEVHLDHFCR